ncbi:MAG: hypothetical protein EAX89_03110 [Candidatus Lokiarchaeota archaeon]|nr:hypothetical protein [Candidatus Lokiarchaeota archaeon]
MNFIWGDNILILELSFGNVNYLKEEINLKRIILRLNSYRTWICSPDNFIELIKTFEKLNFLV